MAFDEKFWSSGFALPLPFGQAPESQQMDYSNQMQQNVYSIYTQQELRQIQSQKLQQEYDFRKIAEANRHYVLYSNDVARFQARVLSQIPVSKKPIEPIVYVQIDEWEIERG